ncbi:MAG: cobalamin-dependent protein, partial [Lentisphaeria bacterium]|nr:cobalamin-dependent protein [Lentisphaeria bacterium]
MKTLIIVPRYNALGRYIMPLGILYVAAAAKQAGCEILTLYLNHTAAPARETLKKIIEEERIACVACGGLSGEFPIIYSLFQSVREIAPNVTIICGGGLVTAEPEVAMRALEYADIGIIGEGDFTFPALLHCLEDDGDLHELKSIIFHDGNQWVQTSPD